jgi:hypothetical protein
VTVRDYAPSDFDRVKEIHVASGIDYTFPDLSSPLFLVTKVIEVDGVVRACGGMYLQAECYLWLDKSDWCDARDKLNAIAELDRACMDATWLRGVNDAVLWLPPGMERFGERLEKDLGFTKDRNGWISYNKKTG